MIGGETPNWAEELSFPCGLAEDGVIAYGEVLKPEHIPGIDPATGKPDSRFDGHVTSVVTVNRSPQVQLTPDPRNQGLVEAVRSTDLLVARDLGVGLADLVEDARLQAQAGELRRSMEERYR